MSISVTIPVIGVTERDMGRYYQTVNKTSLKMGVPQLLGEHFWLVPEYNLSYPSSELVMRPGNWLTVTGRRGGQVFVNMATNVFNPAAIKMGWAAAQSGVCEILGRFKE